MPLALVFVLAVLGWLWPMGGPAWSDIQLDKVTFHYKRDSLVRYWKKRQDWLREHPAITPTLAQLGTLAQQAYSEASLEKEFTQWEANAGPNPRVFRPKVLVVNGPTTQMNATIRVSAQVAYGLWRVHPRVFVTDYAYLEQTAEWEPLYSESVTLPLMAPNEEVMVPLQPIFLFSLLEKYEDRWPAWIYVRVSGPGGDEVQGYLGLVPDQFVVPFWFY